MALTALVARIREFVSERWSEQTYNEELGPIDPAPLRRRDRRWRQLGHKLDGWPYRPPHGSGRRCLECHKRTSECSCPPRL